MQKGHNKKKSFISNFDIEILLPSSKSNFIERL